MCIYIYMFLCVFVCLCVCVCVCVYVCVCVCLRVRACVNSLLGCLCMLIDTMKCCLSARVVAPWDSAKNSWLVFPRDDFHGDCICDRMCENIIEKVFVSACVCTCMYGRQCYLSKLMVKGAALSTLTRSIVGEAVHSRSRDSLHSLT